MRGAVSSFTDSMLLSAISARMLATCAPLTDSVSTPRTAASLEMRALSGSRK